MQSLLSTEHGENRVINIEISINAKRIKYIKEFIDIRIESSVLPEINEVGIDTTSTNRVIENTL